MNHRIFERKLRSRGLTPREHVRLSAASIYPFNKSHSTHAHRGGGIGGTGFTTAGGGGMASDCVNGDCAPTHRYIHIIVCEALMCCRCRCWSVAVGCVCVLCVWGCCPHTRYSGLCCCLLLALPPFIGRRGCAYYGMRSIQLCRVCAWTRSRISGVCVCVCLAHTHTPTPRPTLSPTPARACI